jgi:serralysin
VAALAGSGALLCTAEATAPKPPTLLGFKEPASATDLINSLGVVAHIMYSQTPYANIEKVQQALSYTGIINVRDSSPPADTSKFDYLASHGARFDFVLRTEAVPEMADTVRRLEAFVQRHPGAISSIEGLNEVNNWPAKYKGQGGLAAGVLIQQDLYKAIKASSTLKSIPVYSLTLGVASNADYLRLGDLSGYADEGNAHIYFPKGAPPSSVWDSAYEKARIPTLHLPKAVVTETGYTTSKDSPHGVDEQVQAKYLLTLIAEVWAKQVPRTFIYQLVNDSASETDWTRGLGLYRFDWTAKPAAAAIHNLTSWLVSSGGSVAGPADFDVSATKEGVGSILVKKPNGAVDLLVWREQRIWDGDAKREIPAEVTQVSLTSATGSYSKAAVVDLLTGKVAQVALQNGHFNFSLPDHPVLVEFQ